MLATSAPDMTHETVFTVDPVPLKYGHGALSEIGEDAKALGMTRVALFTDRTVGTLPCVSTAREALTGAGLEVELLRRRARRADRRLFLHRRRMGA